MPSDSDTSSRLPPDELARAFESALAADAPETAGARIGPYKLLQEIGEGGFGTVWMAEQQEPIRRRVALKIIKLGMDTREVIARFEAERQALALMDHPNIARVFDAGATDAGRPYFAMELVRGVPITRYCDENRLPPEARLRLFVTVCQAVQHAHQKGVVHRDLKPSNILVTMHDGVPVPKIIDFGIAKATSAHLTDKTLFTQFHAFLGTPAYTSPEQMEMSGLDVDTRSDIYSLGVLLYELLTGRPPFDPDTLAKSGLDGMRRTIREVDPPRPSARLHTLSDADRTTVAHQRATQSGKLSLLLRGDLDWIVMRCLEKDRTRRYETANGLAMDVHRHLASEPVAARPPSGTYRLRKFVRRHKVGFFAAIAVAASLVAGLIVSSVLLLRERIAHARAVVAEQAEGELRNQADTARVEEVKRVARTALELANRNLDEGHVADGLAYLVYAAGKDPLNPTLAPRLASALASHRFLFPDGKPFACESPIQAVRYAEDGRTYMVGTADGKLRTFDATSGELVREIRLGKAVKPYGGWHFAHHNERILAVYFDDGSLVVFDVTTGQAVGPPHSLQGKVFPYPEDLDRVGVSPDSRWVYARGRQEFWLWDTATGENRIAFSSAAPLWDAEISADSRRLVVTCSNTVYLWSLPDCVPLIEPLNVIRTVPGAFVLFARFSPDGRRLAVCDPLEGIRVLDAETGIQLGALISTSGEVFARSWNFSPDGRLLQLGRGFWNLDEKRIDAWDFPARGLSFESAYSEDGSRYVTATKDSYVRLWDTTTRTLAAEPALQLGTNLQAALAPDGRHVVVGTVRGIVTRLSVGGEAARPLVLPRPAPAMPAPFLAGSPARLFWLRGDSGRILEVASGRITSTRFVFPRTPGFPSNQAYQPPIRADNKYMVVRVSPDEWEAWELGETAIARIISLREAPEGGDTITFSAMGNCVAISSRRKIKIWSLVTGEPVGPGIQTDRPIVDTTGGFSPDGKQIMFSGAGTCSVWDIASGRLATSLQPLQEVPVFVARFSPDGSLIVTGDGGGEARLWDAGTGAPSSDVLRDADPCDGALFSPDQNYLVMWGISEIHIRDGRTGTALGKPIPLAAGRTVRLSVDGRRFVVGGNDGVARVWDLRTQQPVTEPMLHPGRRVALSIFSPDGRFVRTETSAGNFCLWSVPPPPPDGTAVPEWLIQLAAACANKVVNAAGELVDAAEAASRMAEIRAQITALPADAPFAEWGRWIVSDRENRAIAPGFTITPAEAGQLATPVATP